MLLVIGTEATVVRTAPLYGRVVVGRHLRRFDEDFAATAVILDVIGEENSLGSVCGAMLEEIDIAILEEDLPFYFCVAPGAGGECDIVVEIGSNSWWHR
jgi:hypothetical protein